MLYNKKYNDVILTKFICYVKEYITLKLSCIS